MGKTVPAYRMALEEEINRWNGFDRALRIQLQHIHHVEISKRIRALIQKDTLKEFRLRP